MLRGSGRRCFAETLALSPSVSSFCHRKLFENDENSLEIIKGKIRRKISLHLLMLFCNFCLLMVYLAFFDNYLFSLFGKEGLRNCLAGRQT